MPNFRLICPALVALLVATVLPVPAFAQTPPQQVPSSQPVPDDLQLAKLVWSTMAAVDHANRSGNYSVLRDISSPSFQINNDAARLAQIFSGLRQSGTDLSNTLLLAPTYTQVPRTISPGIMQVQGYFGLRPTAISFDLQYQWVNGIWRLYGISILPRATISQQPGGVPPPPAPKKR